MKSALIFLVITTSITLGSCQDAHYYCGRKLADVTFLVCQQFEDDNDVKRSTDDIKNILDFEGENSKSELHKRLMKNGVLTDGVPHGTGFEDRSSKSDVELNWAWMAPRKARALETVRGRRGIANECCDKPCTLDELALYC
ncbi:hypothetical protein O0L34_g10279 [Tuta absoluta]|nr:hypothetical protein O0L34_g10279 [Tuta absoluta]